MSASAGRYLVDADTLLRTIDDPQLRVLDCRFDLMDAAAGRRQFEAGHIPGAVYADLDRDLSGPVGADTGRHPLPAPEALEATLRRLGIHTASRVVAYDDAGGACASRAWWLLRWLGHDNAALLDGGIAAWRRAGGVLEPGTRRPRPGDFTAQAPRDSVVSTADLLAHAPDAGGICLVDARDEARYEGRSEPIDAVAGHVPGARNLPFQRSLDADGRFRAPAELRALWAGVLGDRPAGPWAVMCGSGVTACHLALSAMLAGLDEPRLYAGSWSEWIRDPERPVATGGQKEQ